MNGIPLGLGLVVKTNFHVHALLVVISGVEYRDKEACEGTAYSEPLGQSTGHFRGLPLLWVLPSCEGMGTMRNSSNLLDINSNLTSNLLDLTSNLSMYMYM